LALVFVGLILPYAAIWRIPGGNNWRYTLPAYPFYLVAACAVIAHAARVVRSRRTVPFVREAFQVAGLLAAALLVTNVVRAGAVAERLDRGEAVLVEADVSDGFFLTDGWSRVLPEGAVSLRRSVGDHASLRLPLRRGSDALVKLRMNARPASTV